ncbi:tRNA (5-methylaminomethyl-2-thiouridine)(34)-methyltransferase MnmD [Ichthyenterobacterium sp. W332]|uniref:tRNA (5-methylaminomethyl-2-thiouridine)(34)-methyltransferase MnmD n=1 Tax=Microcosmobacter mediterraneus TaxID=3075607 RepID=A0ABU2YGI1_9FLAO|nr:tRNA (5-methylaminomethyl-2-thiouridine)(34)-methyltransferase MnmD [Ichthyenterobacterium sp. W332]MDT0557287.1 tRNA (5-methylaminomethyl-2-thiouridine)(34)-methyltransferase MnmD [Ichthyenterobacterium sp. W332]
MKRKIITTNDGSKTIHIEDWNEQYHSVHGAIQEANHVFIKHGLLFYFENYCHSEQSEESKLNQVAILEIGFGTGLNAFLTLIESEKLKATISYTGVEAFPVSESELNQLNYTSLLPVDYTEQFKIMHSEPWETNTQITKEFRLKKEKKYFKDIRSENEFNIIYFDAFGARVQPELWTEAIFKIMFKALKPQGVLVTYSAKGSVRRAMQTVGFTVERLPGPPGKREMLRAVKSLN